MFELSARFGSRNLAPRGLQLFGLRFRPPGALTSVRPVKVSSVPERPTDIQTKEGRSHKESARGVIVPRRDGSPRLAFGHSPLSCIHSPRMRCGSELACSAAHGMLISSAVFVVGIRRGGKALPRVPEIPQIAFISAVLRGRHSSKTQIRRDVLLDHTCIQASHIVNDLIPGQAIHAHTLRCKHTSSTPRVSFQIRDHDVPSALVLRQEIPSFDGLDTHRALEKISCRGTNGKENPR